MTHLKSFIKKESDTKEYNVDDIDNPNGWDWKEIDMLAGMGFEPEGNTRLILKVKNNHEMNDTAYRVYKTDEGYHLMVNDRKHLFKTFTDMLNKIDEWGSVEV